MLLDEAQTLGGVGCHELLNPEFCLPDRPKNGIHLPCRFPMCRSNVEPPWFLAQNGPDLGECSGGLIGLDEDVHLAGAEIMSIHDGGLAE